MQDLSKLETVQIKGKFYFYPVNKSGFKGPIKKGFRPVIWLDSVEKSTSCFFLFEGEILAGEVKEINVIVLNQSAFGRKIEKCATLKMGSTKDAIGELFVTEYLGVWLGGNVGKYEL